jgi:long-chain acyl-CoA synthetase
MIPSPRDLPEILSSIQRYKPTLFPGVPNLYQAINQHPDVIAGKVDLSSIKACISGSAPLLPETKVRFEALTGGKLVEGYGLSEAPTATHCNPINNENRPGSIGLPLPDVDCRIVDLEEGLTDLPIGQAGELIIKGPHVCTGYWNNPSATAESLRDGWFHTSDMARMDEEGCFYIVGRFKDMIISGGENVYAAEVEAVFREHESVQDAALIGQPDEKWGEVGIMIVALKPSRSATAEELLQFCLGRLAKYKIPKRVEFVQSLPYSPYGKVIKAELRKLFVESSG